MDDALAGAMISATASIVAALISKTGNEAYAHSSRTKASIQFWIATCPVIGIWSLASPAGIHTVLAHYNFALIPLAMMALVWFRPIQPMIAASVTLGLFAVNWVGWRIAHAGTGTGFQSNHRYLDIYLSLACASAVLVFLLSQWRSKAAKARPVLPMPPSAPPIAGARGSICTELERLAQLHKSGDLSDAEFSRGKEAILGRPRRIVTHTRHCGVLS
jgi:hypothetical protein